MEAYIILIIHSTPSVPNAFTCTRNYKINIVVGHFDYNSSAIHTVVAVGPYSSDCHHHTSHFAAGLVAVAYSFGSVPFAGACSSAIHHIDCHIHLVVDPYSFDFRHTQHFAAVPVDSYSSVTRHIDFPAFAVAYSSDYHHTQHFAVVLVVPC